MVRYLVNQAIHALVKADIRVKNLFHLRDSVHSSKADSGKIVTE